MLVSSSSGSMSMLDFVALQKALLSMLCLSLDSQGIESFL